MVDWNPSFPEVLGPEWLFTRWGVSRVKNGAASRFQRIVSTNARTIDTLRLSATVNPLVREDVRTIVDIYEEGDEAMPLFKEVLLLPNSDVEINDWQTSTGGATDLFESIDETAERWPGPAQHTWIENHSSHQRYRCSVDASDFDTGGPLENARIGFVEVKAIVGANTGFRKLDLGLRYQGTTTFSPAGGGKRDVHGFGLRTLYWWGELNPQTELPWTPADIVQFDTGGDWTISVGSQVATAAKHPRVFALSLGVFYIPVENRVAAAVWRRPEDGTLDEALENVETDALISLPSGAAGWSKAAATNYVMVWRPATAPALMGPIAADDVRWNGTMQGLGPGGQPPDHGFPLHPGPWPGPEEPAPDDIMASDVIAVDTFGRPEREFRPLNKFVQGVVMVDDVGNPDPDSQPYRLTPVGHTIVDDTTGVTGQRMTPASSQSYLGVRFPVRPPLTRSGTLTVTVHRVSDGVQVGGAFTITAEEARALPAGHGGTRYVSGFLSSGAALTGSTQYEVRLTGDTNAVWTFFVADASLAPEVSFGGDTDGAVIDGVHATSSDLAINLIRQPDPPQNVAVAITDVPVTTFAAGVATVQHVEVTWDAPAVSMGAVFARFELERRVDGGDWHRVANLNGEGLLSFVDHEVPRDAAVEYRVRAVGNDGRISVWAEAGPVTPEAEGAILVLTSNHDPSLEVVYLYDPESTYPILGTANDERVQIHGAGLSVVFMESEDRGVGWRTKVTINQVEAVAKGGRHVFDAVLALTRSVDVPYVAALDHQGTAILGHVEVGDARQQQPQHRYTVTVEVTPTNSQPVPVEVNP